MKWRAVACHGETVIRGARRTRLFELAVDICLVQLLLQCVMLRYNFVTFFTNMYDDYESFFTNVSNFFHLIFDFASIFTYYCDDSDSFDEEGTVVEGTAEIQPTCFFVRMVDQ